MNPPASQIPDVRLEAAAPAALSGNQQSQRGSLAVQFLNGALILLLAMASYFFISRFILRSVDIQGISMSPTLNDAERYLLNRWVFYFREPAPGDIVVIRDPGDQGYSVKRIIAGEGQTVRLDDGCVLVNSRALSESYLPKGTRTDPAVPGQPVEVQCGKGQYFVLGDNRLRSIDSRAYGPVSRADILGLIIR